MRPTARHQEAEDLFGTPTVDQLVALRDQRALLAALTDDVREARRRLAVGDLGTQWRSAAQRAYMARVDVLQGELQSVVRLLEDAGDAVGASIDRVLLERFRAGM